VIPGAGCAAIKVRCERGNQAHPLSELQAAAIRKVADSFRTAPAC